MTQCATAKEKLLAILVLPKSELAQKDEQLADVVCTSGWLRRTLHWRGCRRGWTAWKEFQRILMARVAANKGG